MGADWDVLATARNDLADLLEGLTDEQLAAPSLCDKWSVADVAGHVVSLYELSLAKWVIGGLKNASDINGFISTVAKKSSAQGVPTLIQSLRANAGKKLPFYSEGSMVHDTAVHTLDVTIPLGLTHALDGQVLTVALDHIVSLLPKALKGRTKPRLEATDIEWSWGEGPVVRGPGEALLLGLTHRKTDELEGDGLKLLGL